MQNTVINATVGTLPTEISMGFITAQGRGSSKDPSGFVFRGGLVYGHGGQVLLGRAYGAYSRVVFIGTKFNAVVAPIGWDAWKHRGHE